MFIAHHRPQYIRHEKTFFQNETTAAGNARVYRCRPRTPEYGPRYKMRKEVLIFNPTRDTPEITSFYR